MTRSPIVALVLVFRGPFGKAPAAAAGKAVLRSPPNGRPFGLFLIAVQSLVLVSACAGARAESPSTLEVAVAEDEDLGNPLDLVEAPRELDEAEKAALLEDPNATHMTFDGDEANDAPVDRISVPGDRSPSESLMKTIKMGPS